MNRAIFTLVVGLFILTTICANAQDVIVKKDNSTIISKVIKISSTEIEYKKWTNLDGPTYTINKSDVVSINYQNGEVEVISEIIPELAIDTITGVMGRSFSKLTLDGKVLSDEEVLNLIGEQNYESYLGARKQMNVGEVCAFCLCLSLGIDVWGISKLSQAETYSEVYTYTAVFFVSAILTNVMAPLTFVFNGIGKSRLNRIADDFNRKHHTSTAFCVVPSLIKCEMPQLQNNYGLGLTLSLNF